VPDSRSIKIITLQPQLQPGEPAFNLQAIRRLARKALATDGPADFLCLPEALAGRAAETHPAEQVQQVQDFLAELARGCRANVIGGSIEIREADGTLRNRCLIIDRTGRQIGHYDKRILFGAEQGRCQAGTSDGLFELDGVQIGVLICGDAWWPELPRRYCHRAEIIFIPARTGVPSADRIEYARMLWHNLALTRAMENGCAVVVSDWAESRHEPHCTAGAASVADPSARPDAARLLRTLPDGRAGWIARRIDLDAVAEYRRYRQSVGLLPGA